MPKSPGTFPLVIICRSFGIDANEYEELIVHLVNKNCFVLYAPSRRISFTRNKIIDYDFGVDGIIEAVKRFPQIDTTRVGVIGHGFGAGAVPSLMRKLRANSWGNDGAFMYLMSPWYLYSINERDMVSFPQDVSMVVQIFQDDRYNDPRIAADIFNISGIPSSNKSFIIVPTDTIGPVRYKADYVTPLGNNSEFGQFDALDSLAIFRIADSLIAGSFYDDTISCKLLDGEGAFRELHMRSRFVGDSVPPLITSDSPFVHISNRMGVYLNQWNSTRNPRIDANTFRKSRKI
jgi:hypothetical protein